MSVQALRNSSSMIKVFCVISMLVLVLINSGCAPGTPSPTRGPLIEVLEGTRPVVASFRTRPTNTPTPTPEITPSETIDDSASPTSAQAANVTPTPSTAINNPATFTQTPTSASALSSATRTPNPTIAGTTQPALTATPSATSRLNQNPSSTASATSNSTSTITLTPTASATTNTGPAPTIVVSNGWGLSRLNVITDTNANAMYIYGILENQTGQHVDLFDIDLRFLNAQGQELLVDDTFVDSFLYSITSNGKSPFFIYTNGIVAYRTLDFTIDSEPNSNALIGTSSLPTSGVQSTFDQDELAYYVTGTLTNKASVDIIDYMDMVVALVDASGRIIGVSIAVPDLDNLPIGTNGTTTFDSYVLEPFDGYFNQHPFQTIEVYSTGL